MVQTSAAKTSTIPKKNKRPEVNSRIFKKYFSLTRGLQHILSLVTSCNKFSQIYLRINWLLTFNHFNWFYNWFMKCFTFCRLIVTEFDNFSSILTTKFGIYSKLTYRIYTWLVKNKEILILIYVKSLFYIKFGAMIETKME